MPVMLRVMPGDELKQVADALRRIDATLPAKLRRRLRREVSSTVKDVKRHVRTIPVARKSTRNMGLRRRIARGVSVQVATGGRTGFTRMRIVTTMPSKEQAMLPRGLDVLVRPHKGWRHPVFARPYFEARAMGKKNRWVRQGAPSSGWFREEISDHRDEIADGLAKVLEEARDIVARAALTSHRTPYPVPENWS